LAKYVRPPSTTTLLTIVTTMREKPLLRIRLEYEVLRARNCSWTGPSACTPSSTCRQAVRRRPWVLETMAKVFPG